LLVWLHHKIEKIKETHAKKQLIGLGFRHKSFAQNSPQHVNNIWNHMGAYDGWACSIEVHVFT
jgi:hypothetical protein